MIKNINSTGVYIQVSNFGQPHIYNGGQSAGSVRFNTDTQQMEVYTGGTNGTWVNVNSSASVGLSAEAEDAVRWAIERKREEQDLKQRIEQHPGLKDAYEKFQIMDIMTRETDELRHL